jgi:hypothetical protein
MKYKIFNEFNEWIRIGSYIDAVHYKNVYGWSYKRIPVVKPVYEDAPF